jgi:leucyl-tRNA synthetase
VLLITGPDSPSQTALRCRAYAEFYARLRTIGGTPATVVTGPADVAAALAGLARTATVSSPDGDHRTGTRLCYMPSAPARRLVASDGDGQWPAPVVKRHRKAFRRSPGAIFRLPLADGDLAADPGGPTIEVFITDWSPCPAACAVAVHPAHPLAGGLPPGQEAAFAGRLCRHPLTGDLLPVWTARWVRPGFGTGAVLVNPAHDATDLAFARRVGLPIRFALAPAGHDDGPRSWQTPPVIQTGVATRTGPTDGLSFDEAQKAYFDQLLEHGLAEPYDDYRAGPFPVAEVSDGGCPVRWDTGRNTLAGNDGVAAESFTTVPVTPLSPLAVLDPDVRARLMTVIASTTSADTDLLAVRLLLAEFAPTSVSADAVLVGAVSGSVDGAGADALSFTVLTAAPAQDTVALKPQAVEACQRFLDNHRALLGTQPAPDGPAASDGGAESTVKALLLAGNTKDAFTQLYRLQKSLVKAAAGAGAVTRYEALAHVIAGVPSRHEPRALAAAWRSM